MRDRFSQRPGGQRGDLTGPKPVDRGKKGSKIHVITDRGGLPLSVGISAANAHDSQALVPLVQGIPPIRSRRGPRRRRPAQLHADKATTTPTCGHGYASEGSSRASPAAVSSPPSGWADTAGSSNSPCRG